MNKNIILILLAVITLSCTQAKKEQTPTPNVVIVFIDDEGYGDVGCYGATGFQTPNIDGLASQGMRFTNYYAAQAVCSASRAGLLTGCYPNRIGVSKAFFPDHKTGLNTSEYTIAEMFKDQGYTTACFGKWHLGWQKEFLPLQHGFDEFVGLPYSNDMWPRNDITAERLTKGRRSTFPELPLIEGNEKIDSIITMVDQAELTTLYTERAVDFINRNASTPFFLYVPHTMAHIPLGVSDKFKGKSEQGLYGDVMMEIDWSVGEITKTLEQNGLAESTIIIFTSDNGPWTWFGNHGGSAGGLRDGKLTSWDGGQRVPFIIKWPGTIPNGTICNKLACAVDLLPTLASIINGELSDNKIDGVDITELFKGNFSVTPRKSVLYYGGKNNLNAARKGNWKLVLPHRYTTVKLPGKDGYNGKLKKGVIEEPELYNLMTDPGEQVNVIESYPEKAKEIMSVVEKARKELGDLNVGIEKGSDNREVGTLE